MIRRVGFLVLASLVLVSSLDAGPRRRAVGFPGTGSDEATTPAGWLAANAHVLNTLELVPDTSDLFPLRAMIGSSEVVALGDGTHGTHEFYTVKLRVLDYLVREMGFDVLAFEAPFPLMNRIDAYVQGGPGDARAMLHEMYALTYFFWDAEEIVDVVEWMREYNAHRGEKPALHIAGADVTQPDAASNAVLAYLRGVDPVAAVDAEERYACAREQTLVIDSNCQARAAKVFNTFVAREAEWTAQSSAAAYAEALHYARVVVQSRYGFGENRDESLAENALWLREHRGTSGKLILWGHTAHLARSEHAWTGKRPMGKLLADVLGADYFAITTLSATGTFLQWEDPSRTRNFVQYTRAFPALEPTSYESYIRQSGQPYLLIPFRKPLPLWLSTPTRYNAAGVNGAPGVVGSLPLQYDAAIYIETTTPMRPIAP